MSDIDLVEHTRRAVGAIELPSHRPHGFEYSFGVTHYLVMVSEHFDGKVRISATF